MILNFFFFFLLMKNLGAMAYSRYTGFHEITDCDVLELHCIILKHKTEKQKREMSQSMTIPACVPSEDSVQPGHLPSLIRVFAVHMKKAWVLGY